LCSAFDAMTSTFTVFQTGATTGRGYDGTEAVGHVPQTGTPAAQITLVWTSIEAKEANTAVYNTVGRVTAAGDLLIASGPHALARLPIGTAGQVPKVNTAGTGLEYFDPSAAFGIDTTVANIHIVGLNNRSGGTATLGAAAVNHNHGLSGLFGGTEWVTGTIPVTPPNPNITIKEVGVSATTDNLGRIIVTLPDAYTSCIIGGWVTILSTGAIPIIAGIDPTLASLSSVRVSFTNSTSGTAAATTPFNFSLLTIGC
jgi:hypothetical protein